MQCDVNEGNQLYRDGKRVLECLQRALRVADSCMETATSIELFVEILDRYVYYFDQKNESVSHPPSPHTDRQQWSAQTLLTRSAGHHQVPQRPH